MTEQEALVALQTLVSKITNKPCSLTMDSHLQKDGLLDSMDSLVFFMELDAQLGVSVPEDADLVAEGYYSVNKLVQILVQKK